ncbi:hypothetical protein ACFLVY_00330 [Chloroflexota bacterium]
MGTETAKIITSIRRELNIPIRGFQSEEEALAWYRQHYQEAKGRPFQHGFGFRFDITKRILELDYEYDDTNKRFTIGFVPPIDKDVPFDQSVLSLAISIGLDVFLAPALRLLVLVWSVQERLPEIPNYTFAHLGSFRLLVQSPRALSSDQRGKLLDDLKPPQASRITGYWVKRKRQKIGRYLEVLRAYYDWIDEERQRQKKGMKVSKKGYLVWMAEKLVKSYGWELKPSSYTVKRYLDRARELWRFSPFSESEG